MITLRVETGLEPPEMSEAVEGGAALAWRLLATLEGGSLVLAATALLAYSAGRSRAKGRRPVRTVLITNATNALGRELKHQLEAHGCTVFTLTSAATREATSGADKVDAIIVVGAERTAPGIDGIAGLVAEDVYDNLKLLDALSMHVHAGGCMAWACAGATSGAFSDASASFDAALRASLQHTAKIAECEAVWVGRCETAEMAAARVVAELVTYTTQPPSRFSIRNAAYKASNCVGRWLKIVT